MTSKRTQRIPLPKVPFPPDTVCFKVLVPNDSAYIRAFYGAMYVLTSEGQWERDDAHTALLAARRWRDVFYALLANNCDVPALNTGADDGSEFMIRQNPDNPCELQSSVDGTTWCTFADFSKCLPAPSQPGGGTQQPKPGQEQCYHAIMPASSQYLIPVPVSTGDVITLLNATGASNDPDHLATDWICPDGKLFFAGVCTLPVGTVSGDPVAVSHMKLIIELAGTFYDFVSPFTVPSGVSSVQPLLQVNDANITNDNGTLTLDVCVKNNADPGWEHIFDMRITDAAPFLALVVGTYVAGSGWHAAPAGGNLGLEFGITTPSTVFTDVIAELTGVTPNDTSGSSGIDHNPGSGYVSDLIQAVVAGTQTYQVHGTFTSISWLFIWTACVSCSSGSDAICTKITFRGRGVNPFI